MSSKDNADYLMQAAMNHGIKDPRELANFMGQMQIESGGYTSMNENLHYSGKRLLEVFPGRNSLHTLEQARAIAAGGPEAVANAIYGGDWGRAPGHLGNTESGDGWTYHGRGYVQLTGRANYARIGKEMGLDLINHPELAENRKVAANIAVHYWESRVVPHGHQREVAGACHDINGGEKGLHDREAAAASWDVKLAHGHASSITTEAQLTKTDPRANTHAEGGAHNMGKSTDVVLKERAHGSAVSTLQADLAQLGYKDDQGRPLKTDGDFGPNTRHAVERFQHDHHLEVDGIAGPMTLKALDQAQAKAAAADLAAPDNPDRSLYEQALTGVHAIDANMGRTPDQHSDQLAAAIVVAAKRAGMNRIDTVLLSDDGSRAFAVQGKLDSPLKQIAHVQTAEAVNTPMAQSAAAAAQIKLPEPAPTPCAPALSQVGPAMSM